MGAMSGQLEPLMQAVKLQEEVKALKLRLERAYDRLDEQTQLRVRAEDDVALAQVTLELVAGAVCRGKAFGDWLLMQDVSSSEMFSRSKKNNPIENKTDLELALEFIASTAAG